jgi:hypothetical protein
VTALPMVLLEAPIGAVRWFMQVREEQRPMESTMTETTEPTIITEALAVIDKGLAEMLHRELVSTDEVADLLLDVRSLLVDKTSVN